MLQTRRKMPIHERLAASGRARHDELVMAQTFVLQALHAEYEGATGERLAEYIEKSAQNRRRFDAELALLVDTTWKPGVKPEPSIVQNLDDWDYADEILFALDRMARKVIPALTAIVRSLTRLIRKMR